MLIFANEEEVQIKLSTVPVSTQAKKARRDNISAEIAGIVSKIPILFSGDVGVTIQLWRLEQEQYENDRTADIDNVIKPILDGLAGPDGVMIDDNQVQNVQCYWIQHVDAPKAVITIDNRLREYVYKEKLFFVHVTKQLYFPINGFLQKELVLSMLKMIEMYRDQRIKLEGEGLGYDTFRYSMPIQRFFHKTRLHHFRCVELEEAFRELGE